MTNLYYFRQQFLIYQKLFTTFNYTNNYISSHFLALPTTVMLGQVNWFFLTSSHWYQENVLDMKDMSLNIKDNQFWCVKQKRSDELTPYLGTKYLPISSFHVALFKNDRIPRGYMENIYRYIYVGSSISWILMRGKVIAIKGAHPSQFIFWAGLLCSSTKCVCVCILV